MAQVKTAVYLKEPLQTREQVFQFLAEKALELGITTDQEAVYQALVTREKDGSTGMMDGFAIPHGKSPSINEANIIIVTVTEGVEWDSMDGKPIEFILSMMIPEAEKGEGHLKILSQVARMLMKEKVKEELKSASTPEAITQIIEAQING